MNQILNKWIVALSLVTAGLSVTTASFAADISWTLCTNFYFSHGPCWVGGTPPGPSDNAVLGNAHPNYTVRFHPATVTDWQAATGSGLPEITNTDLFVGESAIGSGPDVTFESDNFVGAQTYTLTGNATVSGDAIWRIGPSNLGANDPVVVNVQQTLTVGTASGLFSEGTVFLNAGSTLNVGSENIGGVTGNRLGTFIQDGGTHTVGGNLTLTHGLIQLNGGTLTIGGDLIDGSPGGLGGSGFGNVFIDGGVLEISGGNGSLTADRLKVGQAQFSIGSHTLSGTGSVTTRKTVIGEFGNGTFNQTGGTHTTDELEFATNDDFASAVYNLSGGTLDVATAITTGIGSLVFNINGGTLLPVATADFFTSGSELNIGTTGTGLLTVASGSNYSGNFVTLAVNAGSAGTVEVDGGTFSTGTLTIGDAGAGDFTVHSGGTVTSGGVFLGFDSGATGHATLSGSTSTWSSGPLSVGINGQGTLLVEDGGVLTSSLGLINNGTVTVTGSGSQWNTSVVNYISVRNGTLSVENGATVYSGQGTVGSGIGGIGFGVGIVNISGTGSKWTTEDTFFLASEDANGTVNLSGGGQLQSKKLLIAHRPNSFGTANISGADSKWIITDDLAVGGDLLNPFGIGAVDIDAGGSLVAGATAVIWGSVDISGGGRFQAETLNLKPGATFQSTLGAVDDLATPFDGQAVSQVLNIDGGTFTNSASFTVAQFVGGNGTMNIFGGGQLSNTFAQVGLGLNSTGVATVDGANSRWDNSSNLLVGFNGSGTLGITDNATVTAATIFIGHNDNASGDVTVDNATLEGNSTLFVGRAGHGSLLIENGGHVSNSTGQIGTVSGSMGNVTVRDPGSLWANSGSLFVGNSGLGFLEVLDQASVTVGSALSIGNSGALELNGGSIETGSFSGGAGFLFFAGSLLVDGGTFANGTAGSENLFTFLPAPNDPAGARTLTLDNGATAVLDAADRSIGGGLGTAPHDTLNIFGGSSITTGPGTTDLRVSENGAGNRITLNIDGAGSIWDHAGDMILGGALGANQGEVLLHASQGGLLHMAGSLVVGATGKIELADGGIAADTVSLDSVLEGFGSATGVLTASNSSSIHAFGGTLTVGDASRFQSFSTTGAVTIDAGAVLNIETLINFNRLGPLTQLNGGELTSNTGVTLEPGRIINGFGAVNTRIAATIGSSIVATGALTLGDANAFDGFFSDGLLHTGANTVVIHDRNQAVLGSLTTIGEDGLLAGALEAPNGFLLDFGKTLSGYGDVFGDVLNNGQLHGAGPGLFDGLTFHGLVSGVGDFSGSTVFLGGFSPGLSPTISNFNDANAQFISELELEIGGLTPGSSGHDQIIVTGNGVNTGFVQLGGILNIEIINGWMPSLDDVYVLLMAEEILFLNPATPLGFDVINFPQIAEGLQFALEYLFDPDGTDTLTLHVTSAVPLPAAFWMVIPALGVLLRRKRI